MLQAYLMNSPYRTLSNVQDALEAIEHLPAVPYLISLHVLRINLDLFAEEVEKIEREFMVSPLILPKFTLNPHTMLGPPHVTY